MKPPENTWLNGKKCISGTFSSIFLKSLSPGNEEEDIKRQRHSQGQPPPIPDEVGDARQEQLTQRVTVARYGSCDGPDTSGNPLHDCKHSIYCLGHLKPQIKDNIYHI